MKKKILIIEDELSFKSFLVQYFQNKYYITAAISNPLLAIRHIFKNKYYRTFEDIVLCDYNLGHNKITGELLLKQVEYSYLNNPLLILMSGEPVKTNYKFLQKPFKISDLESILKSGGFYD